MSKQGYAVRAGPKIGNKQTTIRMHRIVIELSGEIIPPNKEVDHISRDKLDNRIENLRIVSRPENQFNRTAQNNNTSGYKGVSLYRQNNRWVAHIKIAKVKKNLGYFENIIDAAKAYDEAAKQYYGKFAVLNFPIEEN